jgi:hypothetical protein
MGIAAASKEKNDKIRKMAKDAALDLNRVADLLIELFMSYLADEILEY